MKESCIFDVTQHQQPIRCYQAYLALDRQNMDREMNGMIEGLIFFNHDMGYIVTMNRQDEIKKQGKTITIVTAHDLMSGLYI